MKKILMSVCLLAATGLVLHAQTTHSTIRHKTEAPMMVTETFHHDYPDASAVNWKLRDGKWEANFHKMDGNMTVMACYDSKGRHIDSRMPVAQSAVPTKVIHRLNDKYSGSYVHAFTKIERPRKRELYRVRVKDEGSYKTLYLDKKGHEREYASR